MSSCAIPDKDQCFQVQDYGPGGIVSDVSLKLTHGLKPGAIISAVITSDQDVAINIRDAKEDILIHVVARVTKNTFAFNSHLSGAWGPDQLVTPVPTQKGCRFVATIVYEVAGYRVFVNGAEVGFYKHRSSEPAHWLEITSAMTFKVVYLTMRDIVPT